MEIQKRIQFKNILLSVVICFLVTFINDIVILNCSKVSSISQTQNVNVNTEDKKDKIDLNTSSLEGLKSLPGIGNKKAQMIIKNRPYTSVYDLEKIKGINSSIIDNIKGGVVCK